MTMFDALTEILAGVSKLRTAVAEAKTQGKFTPDMADKLSARLGIASLREVYNQMVEATGGQRRRGPRKHKDVDLSIPKPLNPQGRKTA